MKARKRDRQFTTDPAIKIKLELVHIPDKRRAITAPQPAWNVVRVSAERPGISLILREWNFCEDIEGKTREEANEANWKRASDLFEQTRRQLGGKEEG